MWQGNGRGKNDGEGGENCVHLEEWKSIARNMQFLDGLAKLREALLASSRRSVSSSIRMEQ